MRVPARPWERVGTWLVLVGALSTSAIVLLMAVSEPRLFRAAVASGAVPWYSLLFPVLRCVAAVLLVRLHRWSYPLLAVHLVSTVAYAVATRGGEAISGLSVAGFFLSGLAVVFASYLSRTGKLR